MIPWLIGGGTATALGVWAYERFIKKTAANLPPMLVSQGIPDPTTGKTIVTLADEQQAFKNVEAASTFPDDAKNLYTYLKSHWTDGSPALRSLVLQFQRSANKVLLGTAYRYGKLAETGDFDLVTSGALAQATEDPILPDPNIQRPALKKFGVDTIDVNDASTTGAAAFLLNKYIELNGNDPKDPVQVAFTKLFQIAVNTDPMFPGPGWAMSASKNGMAARLTEDGILGPATKTQLSKYS